MLFITFLFLLLGYWKLIIDKRSEYETLDLYYEWKGVTIFEYILQPSITYWLIGFVILGIEMLIPRAWNKFSSIKNDKPPMNQFVTMCFSFWIIINLCRVIYQFVYIINGIDTWTHLYNIVVGILCCILLYKILRRHKLSLFLFYVFEITNGVVISDIEKDYSSLLFSLFACIIVSVLLLFKNKDGQSGYAILSNDKRSEQELLIKKTLAPKDTNSNLYGSKAMTNESQYISMIEITNIDNEAQKHTDSLFCKSCGKPIDNDSRYCNHCGSIIQMEEE